ncbi:MAG: hypothetical protein U0441_20275 [Polyangiaceae bacterium]
MSLLPRAAEGAPAPTDPSASSVHAWTRVLGTGAIQRDFGHEITANARGEVLVAARLGRLDDTARDDNIAVPRSRREDTTVDLSAADLLRLGPSGETIRTVRLRAALALQAPAVALDDAGGAYIAGPYVPQDGALRGARDVGVTKLGPDGRVEWARALFELPQEAGRPRVQALRSAADPSGGVCLTWIGEQRRWRAVRAVRLASDGAIAWDYSWPITAGHADDPHVGVDESGAALLWGTFRGSLALHDGVRAESASEARYFVRIEPDGRLCWAYPLPAYSLTPHAIGVARDGEIAHVFMVPAVHTKGPRAAPLLVVRCIDTDGKPRSLVRGQLDRHGAISSLCVAPGGRDGFTLAGYFSGVLQLGDTTLQSVTPASEAVFIAHVNPNGAVTGRAFQGPQLQAGLSVHASTPGSVVVGGWLCGSMVLGDHTVTSPAAQAALFLASLPVP